MLRPPLGRCSCSLPVACSCNAPARRTSTSREPSGIPPRIGSVSGETDFFDIEGDDADSSPAYGGSLGLAFAIDEAVPHIKGFEMPSWILRTEIEFQMGRDYELRSDGAQADDFFSEVDAWTPDAERLAGRPAAHADLVAVRARARCSSR